MKKLKRRSCVWITLRTRWKPLGGWGSYSKNFGKIKGNDIREERELIVQLKGVCPDNKIPTGLILDGHEALKETVDAFSKAKEIDSVNEMRPNSWPIFAF